MKTAGYRKKDPQDHAKKHTGRQVEFDDYNSALQATSYCVRQLHVGWPYFGFFSRQTRQQPMCWASVYLCECYI